MEERAHYARMDLPAQPPGGERVLDTVECNVGITVTGRVETIRNVESEAIRAGTLDFGRTG